MNGMVVLTSDLCSGDIWLSGSPSRIEALPGLWCMLPGSTAGGGIGGTAGGAVGLFRGQW